ncbi:arginine--tRNA ligase [Thiotrichales bacterium 19S3-7]|nr:arginine--tRNA ligase [Thiotrichales bacterium 19S3-7]MCF6802826.1 arginine--tRNA ligase [Thiotrichales bacterium 19S3-11]
MKQELTQLLQKSINDLIKNDLIPNTADINIIITPTKQKSHGDLATNLALTLAKQAKKSPKILAEAIVKYLPKSSLVKKVEIAGPGFINFYLNQSTQFEVVKKILTERSAFGQGKPKHIKINIEFTSANPTGPLHVGHGRGAAIGSAIASLLKFAGYDVESEYYVNDAGRQMDILATSVWLRYIQAEGEAISFPSNGYKGEYIKDIANDLRSEYQTRFMKTSSDVFANVHDDFDSIHNTGDKEKHIDDIISNAKHLLKSEYTIIHQFSLNAILNDIRADLEDFGVYYDNWFSEKSLEENQGIDKAIDFLDKKGLLYEKEGAIWFKSTNFDDDKDRVLVRANGQRTYFASDAAYMLNKFHRGFDQVIYLFGTDHHGYIPRIMALAEAFGFDKEKVTIPLIQFAILYQGGEQVQMSTRSGSFVTLRQLRQEVGSDAARYFYIMRKADQHLDFDLDLAKSKSNENPVYYVQYAHARICSVFRQLSEQKKVYEPDIGLNNLSQLDTDIESDLANKLMQYPELIEKASTKLEPHLLTNYLRDLAQLLHMYYNQCKFIVDNLELTQARLVLIDSVREVINNTLSLLNINAPEVM